MSLERSEAAAAIEDHDVPLAPSQAIASEPEVFAAGDELAVDLNPSTDSQPDAAETENHEAPSPAEEVESPPTTDSEASLTSLREQVSQRIASSQNIPRGMRERLAEALCQAPLVAEGNDLLAPVGVLLGVIESWAPSAFRFDPSQLRPIDHPAGETYFTGDPHDLSDEQAAAIARRQLQLTGYLPRGDSR